MKKSEECIICGAPLEYLNNPVEMECAICHRRFTNNVRCEQGHYVCDECHTSGIDNIIGVCMKVANRREPSDVCFDYDEHEQARPKVKGASRNPIEIVEKLMALPTCHMHGPEHHIMVGASLLTAYKNAGGDVDLEWALSEIVRRGKQVPGGACGNWGYLRNGFYDTEYIQPACEGAILYDILSTSQEFSPERWKTFVDHYPMESDMDEIYKGRFY